MTSNERRPEINMSGIPVAGIGGLGLVAVAALMTVVLPAAWDLVVAGALGGVLLGVVLIAFHRIHRTSGPSGSDPTILFRPEPQHNRPAVPSRDGISKDARLAAAH